MGAVVAGKQELFAAAIPTSGEPSSQLDDADEMDDE